MENKEIIEGKDIYVWFSNGAASAIAAKKTAQLYGGANNVFLVNNPIKEEDKDNLRFQEEVSDWVGLPIIKAINSDWPSCSCVDVWEKRKYMSGNKGAPCTMLLKKEARYQFEKTHKIDWHVLGFTFDEKKRSDKFILAERRNTIPVLISEAITKKDCFNILDDAKIQIPRIYRWGYPNANCIGCVKSSSPTYWNLVRGLNKDVFDQRAEQSRRIGCKLVKVKGKRIFLDELDPQAKGGSIGGFECGIFCDTE